MTEHIQINDVVPRVQYLADGIQSAFTFPFAIFKLADLEVWQDDALQAGGYTVSGAGVSTGGVALFVVPPAAGSRITLRRRLTIARTTDYQSDGLIRAKTLNDELDYQVAALQQVAEDVDRAVRRAPTALAVVDLTLPAPVAGKAIGWNAAGTGLTNDPADFAGTVAAVTAQAGVATTQTGIATAAAATAGGHAVNAGTQAGIATTQAGNAAASAAAALASEAAAQAYAEAADVAKVEWRGAWNSATAYALHDAVSYAGSSWICVQAHTNQVPIDNAYWDVLAAKGADGAGAGDLVAANNLSDLANISAARTNLGLGSAATQASTSFLARTSNLSDLADVATARSNLGVPAIADIAVNARTAEPAIDLADLALIHDASASADRKITIGDLLKAVNLLAADGSPDKTADYVMTWDASASDVKKVLLSSLGGGAWEYVGTVDVDEEEAVGSVAFTGLASGYDYRVVMESVYCNGTGQTLAMYTYVGGVLQSSGYSWNSTNLAGAASAGSSGSGSSYLELVSGLGGSGSSTYVTGEIDILHQVGSTGYRLFGTLYNNFIAGGADTAKLIYGRVAGPPNGFLFQVSGGALLVGGEFRLYRRKRSA